MNFKSASLLFTASTLSLCLGSSLLSSCTTKNATAASKYAVHQPQKEQVNLAQAEQNLSRSIQLIDQTIAHHFDAEHMEMHRFYNPFTGEKSSERASVWMYSAGIEAVNAVLHGLQALNNAGQTGLYNAHYKDYVSLLDRLYQGAEYYLGSFQLTSYTQTRDWTVYAVNRAAQKGGADVTGVLNVYDDQMWLVRELIDSYKVTRNEDYLEKAEYLTSYVLDGWDVNLDADNKEIGGITWGPGYTTKHACSNGPMVSPLVWLSELYQGKNDQIQRHYIDPSDQKTRKSKSVNKASYYLDYAKAVYDWQKKHLLNEQGVYTDMMGGCVPDCQVRYEEIQGTTYRAHTGLRDAVGKSFSYNSGTMLSGAADLYRVTAEEKYKNDGGLLAENSFAFFAHKSEENADLYAFETDGFNNWFNGVLLRGFQQFAPYDSSKSAGYLQAFQQNLDYGFEHHLAEGFLPQDLLKGWTNKDKKQGVEGMFMFSFAAQYAVLAQQQL